MAKGNPTMLLERLALGQALNRYASTRPSRLEMMQGAMRKHGVEVKTDKYGRDLFVLNLLGRRATCTSSADGAILNWAEATMKEAAR